MTSIFDCGAHLLDFEWIFDLAASFDSYDTVSTSWDEEAKSTLSSIRVALGVDQRQGIRQRGELFLRHSHFSEVDLKNIGQALDIAYKQIERCADELSDNDTSVEELRHQYAALKGVYVACNQADDLEIESIASEAFNPSSDVSNSVFSNL